jgi:IS30 family transposase
MDYPYNTTDHAKWKHLTYEDYVTIELRLKDGWSANRIAREELNCSPNTVRNIIRKGMVALYNGKVQRFKAKAAWAAYTQSRANSCRHFDALEKSRFLDYVVQHFKEDGWSMDACAGRALVDGEFTRDEIVCTKTLYNYVDMGLLDVKNIDLPVKLRRSTKKHKSRENKRILGRSIEERPECVETREEFGHWEADLVIGSKSGEDTPLLTMLERKTRSFTLIPLADKSADSVAKAFENLRAEWGESFSRVFKTITTDNGSEFARLAELETLTRTKVYFAHPYTSWEKGSIENHNGLIRRFIPKGKRISDYSEEHILNIELWANQLPRKILGYKTPDEAFEHEMDLLFAA